MISVEKGLATPVDSPANNVYTRAEAALKTWIAGDILVRDARPGIYVYFQDYTVPGGTERRTRKGFIALGRVEDYSAGVVYRHEQTLSGRKLTAWNCCATPAPTPASFLCCTKMKQRSIDAQLDAIAAGSAPAEAKDEYAVVHRLWPVFDPNVIAKIVNAMAPQKLVIADGHHRYETALAYRNERRAQGGTGDPQAPYEKVMMTFFNTATEGLLILPTHRVVANLPGFNLQALRQKMAPTFTEQDYSFGGESARAAAYDRFRHDLRTQGRDGRVVGMYSPGTFALFHLRPDANLDALMPDVPPAQRRLDVMLLHRVLLQDGLGITPAAVTGEKNLTYEREMNTAIATVDEGKAQACFLLNAVSVDTVTHMALNGEVLPQKSTDFYPKLLSGLTLYRMN